MANLERQVNPPSEGPKVRQIWTPEEDQRLIEAVQRETPPNSSISWYRVADHMPGRTNKDCRKRWYYSIMQEHTIRKGTWTKEEDRKLREAVATHGSRWSRIAEAVGTRNGDQCWKRWYDCLDPKINRSPWTPEEDELLLKVTAIVGRNWTAIVNKHFPKRTSLSAKNRHSILQRKLEASHNRSQGATATARGTQSSPSAQSNFATKRDPFDVTGDSFTEVELTTADNRNFGMMPTHQNSTHLQVPPDYWSLSSSDNLSSACSSPDPGYTNQVDWSSWNTTTGDQYRVNDRGSYPAGSSGSTLLPQLSYDTTGVFLDPMTTFDADSIGYSPVYNGGLMNEATIDPTWPTWQ